MGALRRLGMAMTCGSLISLAGLAQQGRRRWHWVVSWIVQDLQRRSPVPDMGSPSGDSLCVVQGFLKERGSRCLKLVAVTEREKCSNGSTIEQI